MCRMLVEPNLVLDLESLIFKGKREVFVDVSGAS